MLASALIHAAPSQSVSYGDVGASLTGNHTCDLLEDFLGDFGGNLVLGQCVWVGQSIICEVELAAFRGCRGAIRSFTASPLVYARAIPGEAAMKPLHTGCSYFRHLERRLWDVQLCR